MSEGWLGIVTSVDPLRVRRDYPTSQPPPSSPDTLVSDLRVGDKVFIMEVGRRWLVVGRVGGDELAPRRWSYDVWETPADWLTVARFEGSGRADATFRIYNGDSGDHDLMTVQVTVAYNESSMNLLSYSPYGRSSPAITAMRYLRDSSDTVYGPGLFQIKANEVLKGWSVVCEQPESSALDKGFEPMYLGTSTTGYTPHMQYGVAPTSWELIPLASGWSNYGTGWARGRMKMSPGGLVVLEGLISYGSGGSKTITTLPPGMRPEVTHIFNPHGRAGGQYVPVRMDIKADGAVNFEYPTYSTAQWISLSGITFQAYH